MAILISPLVLLFDTTLTNPTTTPAIGNMLSYAALRGGVKESNGPEKVLETALLNLIFSVAQTGTILPDDIHTFQAAWEVALPYIPLPPAEDPSGAEEQVDGEQTGGSTQEATKPAPSTPNQPDPAAPSDPPIEPSAAGNTETTSKTSKKPRRKKRSSYYGPSKTSRRKGPNQTAMAQKQRIHEIAVTKEETMDFELSEDVESFPDFSAVRSLYKASDTLANPPMDVDTPETSTVSGFGKCQKHC
jgi:hypothetical protein